jgi:hypothetical protein
MSLVVPAGYISTPDAFTEMLTFDSEWRRLSESWEKDDRPVEGPAFADIDERQEALANVFYKAVAAGEIVVFAYTLSPTGKRFLEELTGAYRSDPAAKIELRLGKISAGRMSRLIFDMETSRWSLQRDRLERLELHGAALCFRRADLGAWLARHFGDQTTLTASEGPSLHAAIRKWNTAAYPDGNRVKSWKVLAGECSKALDRDVSEKTMQRALPSLLKRTK